jgi:hypothetical protein
MPGSHTSASLIGTPLVKDTQAPGWPVQVKADWRLEVRLRGGRGGNGTIAGTVKVKGTPDYAVSRRVRLYRDRDGILVGETWSDPTTGAYTFDGLDRSQRYTVLALDHTGNFRAVPADNLTPEAA